MPNKSWEMRVDMIPKTNNTFNLGDSTHKWNVNGYSLGDACAKGVDTSIADESTSTNVPTTGAVVSYVEGHATSISVSGTTLIITGPQEASS